MCHFSQKQTHWDSLWEKKKKKKKKGKYIPESELPHRARHLHSCPRLDTSVSTAAYS
jgi:hypothetical protein